MTTMNHKYMKKDAKIFVAGHRGLMGSALCKILEEQGYHNLLKKTRSECDLTDMVQVRALFEAEKPEYVFLAAAKVGGIWANANLPADFIYQNLAIQCNIIECARAHQVQRLLFLGSSCIYPRSCPQPILEEYLLSAHLEPTNRPYALAKIAGIEMCWAYNRQHGTRYLSAMPTNLYGPGDNYDLKTSHVIPALLRKFHEAKKTQSNSVTIWGSGTPKREFLYSEDCARACVHLLNLPEESYSQLLASTTEPPLVNIGYGEDVSIKSLATLVQKVVGFNGVIEFDKSKPDGAPRKLVNVDKLRGLGFEPTLTLEEGLRLAYEDFLSLPVSKQEAHFA